MTGNNIVFMLNVKMMWGIGEVREMRGVIPTLDEALLRRIHPLVTVFCGHTAPFLKDKIFGYFQIVSVF